MALRNYIANHVWLCGQYGSSFCHLAEATILSHQHGQGSRKHRLTNVHSDLVEEMAESGLSG